MVRSPISDRLLEISKYVSLDPIGRKILIDQTSMWADEYYYTYVLILKIQKIHRSIHSVKIRINR